MQMKARFKMCSTIGEVSVCLFATFIFTFLSGVSSELSAGDLKRDVEKTQRDDNDGDHDDDSYSEVDQKLDGSPGRGSESAILQS